MPRLSLAGPTEPAEIEYRDGTVYPVRYGSDLDVTVMAEILELTLLERKIHRSPKTLAQFAKRAKILVMDTIRDLTPDAPDLAFSPTELAQILHLLADHVDGATGAVAETLTEGHPGADDEGADEPSDPTASRPRSRRRRSQSESSSSGRQDGGKDADGAPSAPRSPTSTAA